MWKVYVAVGAVATAGYFLSGTPDFQTVLYDVMAYASFVTIVIGIRRNRPADRLPWLLLATGILMWAVGDTIWSSYDLVLHQQAPWPSVADYAYLTGPILMALGLTGIIRDRDARRDADGLLAALIVAIGAGTLSWTFLIAPSADAAGAGLVTKAIAMAYPFSDVLLLVVIVRMLLAPGRPSASHRLLAIAVVCTLVVDVIYSIQSLNGTYYTGNLVDVGWLAFYVLMGAAALHPSMASTTRPKKAPRSTRWRFAAMGAFATIAPVTIIIQTIRGQNANLPVVAAASLVTFLLVVVRMERLVSEVGTKADLLQTQKEELGAALDERKELERKLRYQAFHDPLTDLPNRSLFHDRVAHALTQISRTGDAVGLLYMDVDDFKTINDTLGHEAGDHLLIDISERLRGLLRGSDSPARLGGDEFAVILEGMKSTSDGGAVADRILEAMTVPFRIGEHVFDIRVSIGIASTNEPSMTGADLLRQADTAMYAAKIGGKNRYVTYEPSIQKELFGSVAMKIQLKRAIERGELRAVYQPIVDLRSGRLNGAEALVRWQHPDEGLIPPGSFLPMAEESGVIADIDRWMIGEACAEAVRWRRLGIEVPPPISLNLSAASLQRDDLVNTVSAILASTGALPRDIAFEVTESSLVEDLEATAERLTALKSLGMEISIDDFGTGYSSLNYLRRFPIDVLKIDKSFVDGIARGPEEASFAIAIIQLAEQLHLRTVAEGIETGDQARVLMDLGVGSAQGFYFSRPVGADTMRDLIVNAERGNDWSDLINALPVPA